MPELPPFREMPSIPRLSRDMIVTEKIDGANASVFVSDQMGVLAASRTRWISPGKGQDNHGFAAWVQEHAADLAKFLGAGHHFGEWWGKGIQRGYGVADKRFSLFNVGRWEHIEAESGGLLRCVPVLTRWTFDTELVDRALQDLAVHGSYAAPGYDKPEGVVVFHAAGNVLFKKTLDKNDAHKSTGNLATGDVSAVVDA